MNPNRRFINAGAMRINAGAMRRRLRHNFLSIFIFDNINSNYGRQRQQGPDYGMR